MIPDQETPRLKPLHLAALDILSAVSSAIARVKGRFKHVQVRVSIAVASLADLTPSPNTRTL